MANYSLTYTGAQIQAALDKVTNMVNLIYPVGSIYISTNSTNPNALFGVGTWEQVQGRFLLGQSSSYAAGSTGGEATHTLTEAEMPKHVHKLSLNWTSGGSASTSGGEPWAIEMTSGTGDGVGTWPYGTDSGASGFGYTGNSQAHNNMPPYLSVYIWKRTA